jgi:hypothetical protein
MNDQVSVRVEGVHFGFVAAFSVLLGALAGVVWHAVGITATLTPKAGAVYLPDDEKFFLDNDLRFALVALVTGIVVAVLVMLICPDTWIGPGMVLGLAAGGVLGALVAAHVGHVLGHHALMTKVDHYAPGADPKRVSAAIDSIDFKVRWWLGAAAWPFAAVGSVLGTLWLRGRPVAYADPQSPYALDNAGRGLSSPRTLES